MSDPAGDGPVLRAGPLRLALAPQAGGAVAGFWLERPEGPLALLRPLPQGAADALQAAMFPMLPFVNCIRDNRFRFAGRDWRVEPNMPGVRLNFHGSGWRRPWRVAAANGAAATLALEADDGIWTYAAEQRFALDPRGLEVTLSVTNRGRSAMPFGIGLHPWFPRHGEARVQFAARRLITTDADGQALGEGPVPPERDHAVPAAPPMHYANLCYAGWDGRARILWPGGIVLTLTADAVLGYLMMHVPAADPSVFCLEPQTDPPCGFDALGGCGAPGVHVLAAGGQLAGRMRLDLTAGPDPRARSAPTP